MYHVKILFRHSRGREEHMKYNLIYSLANDYLGKTKAKEYCVALPEQKNNRCAMIAALDYLEQVIDTTKLIWPLHVTIERRTEKTNRFKDYIEYTDVVRETFYGGLLFYCTDGENVVQIRVIRDGTYNALIFNLPLGYDVHQLVDVQTFETYDDAKAYVTEYLNDAERRNKND